jgi:PAS domain S-box-containing protein
MGPYAFTQAFLSGFFSFSAVAAFVIWSRSRRDLTSELAPKASTQASGSVSLLILAIGSCIWAAQSAAVAYLASSDTVAEAQRALDLRTIFGALSVAATAWMFAEITGMRARAFVWFVTISLIGVAAATAAGVHLLGEVTHLERVALPWGEVVPTFTRTEHSRIAAPIYGLILSVIVFTLVSAYRYMARDRVGGALLLVGALGLGVAVVSAALIDLLRIRWPYPGMFAVAFAIVVIALQFARANRQRDEQLVTADRRFRAIFDQTFQFIGLMSVDGTLLEANATALRFAGVRQSDVIGKKFWDTPWWAHSRALQDRLREAVDRAARGIAVRFEATHPGPDGLLHHIDFSLKPVRDARAAVVLLIPEGHDITERKKAEEALRASEERYRVLIHGQTEFVVTCRPDTTLTFVNDSYSRYFGTTVDAAVGTPLLDLLAPRDRDAMTSQISALTVDAPIATLECQVVAASGKPRWAQWTMSGTFSEAGTLTDLQMTGRDIHDRVEAEDAKRTLEQQLLQSQKMEALGQLAGGVAHDFNNLLTVIAGHTDMLIAGDRANGRHDLDQIRSACQRGASMTRQLLAFSRQSVFEPKIVDVNSVVAQTETMLRRTIGEQIELTVRAGADVGAVRADPDQLSRVLLNMAINARDAMPDGGRLSIETRNVILPDRGDGRPTAGEYVVLGMSDTGCGIPAELRGRLFEPFFTTKPQGKGTGLGLAVVDGIVKQSGGWIEVESEVGVGTTFQIFLPGAGAAGVEAVRSREGFPARGSETVLLVEDEAAVRDMAQTALASYGYKVLSVANGEDALRTVAAHHGRIDLLLTDVIMPGVSGPELAERVRREYPGIAVVFMSGYTSDAVLRKGVEAGEENFVQKPFSTVALATKLRQVLDRR